jgi:hypothetical protein
MGQTPPRVTFKQLQKDTLTGSIAISGLDSNLTYSRDFYISADSFLILYGDTVGQGSLNAILVDGVTILGDGVSTNLSADTNLIKDIIGAMVNAGLGIDITYDPIDKELLIESLSVEDYVKNGTGLSIPKGTPLYVTGISGNFWEVAPADASHANKMPVVAIAGETIGAGDEGIALIKGHIKGVNTSAFTAGDKVYVAPGGGYTNVRPKGETNLVQFLGTVVKADANGSGIINLGEVEQNLNPGRIFIGGADSTITRISLTDSLNAKANVSFNNVTGTLPVANGGTGVSSLTANKVLVGNGTSGVLTPTNLHWDNTNSRLGIGITAPRVALEVNADQIIDASNVWTARTSAADNQWFSVTYGNGLFVAVSSSGTGNRVMTSPDGITWTARTSAADNNWHSVTYGNGLFVAVAFTGTGNRVMTSPDGITWTARTSAADNQWFSVTYGNGLFVAVAGNGSGNRVMTSPDGITWTARTSAADNNWISVTYANGLFVAVAFTGTGNRVMTSPDGITWTARTSAADNEWRYVTYGNGLFVAVAQTGTGNRVMTSLDGITWTARTSPADNQWFSVTYGNGLFVAVARTGSGNRVMTSPDGITWTARTSAADNEWRSVTYGNGLFVAVAATGSGNRVMTSGKQYKQDLAHNNIWQGNQYMPFVYNQTTAEAANMYIDTTTGELKRSTSSIRYKTNVELYQKGLNDLLNLTPVTFKGINDGNKTFAGFIAEELDENGLTEFVQYDAQGKPDAIRYNQMVTILTKSIQELFAIIEELQVKIQILENKN